MGGFLAEPGHFNVFPGRVDEYYSSPGASVTTADPALIPVIWRGIRRAMYFPGLCGPHPEAPPEWYREACLRYGGSTQDLGDDLVITLMAP